MKNVTITLEEDLAQWTRICAAKQGMSVSRLIASLLKQQMEQEAGYENAMHEFLSRPPRVLKQGGGYPQRDELHDRDMLR